MLVALISKVIQNNSNNIHKINKNNMKRGRFNIYLTKKNMYMTRALLYDMIQMLLYKKLNITNTLYLSAPYLHDNVM